jgi:hypothetical protein
METDVEIGNTGIRPAAIVLGAVLLALGGTLLLDRNGLLHVSYGQLIGPFVLIALGAVTIVEKGGIVCGYRRPSDSAPRPHARRGGMTTGIWLIGLGVWMLVSQIHLWGLDYHNSWPLVVILSGVVMLMRGIR